MGSKRIGRIATVIVKAVTDSNIEIIAGRRRFELPLATGEIFKYVGYIDNINWDGQVQLAIFDSDVDINVQVSSSGIITELQLLAKESTAQAILAETQTANATLSAIDAKLAQPTALKSASIVIDNSAGTTDLAQPLFNTPTPSRSAIIKVASLSGVGSIYIGDATAQSFSLAQGDVFKTEISDLSNIYIRVPAGGSAVIEVAWEV